MMKRVFWISCLALVAGCATSPQHRAQWLVRRMTLDEKISQIHMVDTKDHPREVTGIRRLGVPVFKITNGPLGAGPGDVREVLPATALPAALALAASWDVNLATRFGEIAGQEVVAHGDDLLEGPGVNITRVPRNGRNFEYFGEDPFLSARMAVAEIRAIQGQNVIAEVKHFAANSQENSRKSVNEFVDERTLREIYLPAFEAAVKEADVGAVMAAYPSVNGEFCARNTHLLKDILRDEWRFKGFVQSDYSAVTNGVQCARAGMDLSMKPQHFSEEIKVAVTNGELPGSILDAMVTRRFAQMFKYGMFDSSRTQHPIPAKEHGAVARTISEQSAVLLKNNGDVLPLDAKAIHSIALIGPYAGAAHTGGRGSSMVKPLYTVTPLQGLTNLLGTNVTVTYNAGTNLDEVAAIAKSADVALVMVGNRDGEGHDRLDLSLPTNQDLIVSAAAAANPKTIVVLKTGGPVLMPWLDQVPAVLEAWYPGEEDGNVVADLLFGLTDPSGKLPLTFPKTETEVPASTPQQYPGVDGDAIYSEKLLVGYRWYDAKDVAPLFPFGFGLSYTTFAVTNLVVTPFDTNATVRVSLDVSNTGSRDGAEVVQVYVAAPTNAMEPPKQLKGFAKVALKPGETRHLTIILHRRAFSFWNTSLGEWVLAPGQHEILAGTSSRDLPLHATVTVPDMAHIKPVRRRDDENYLDPD